MNADREIREAARLRRLLDAVAVVARILAERRNEPATMPEGVLGRGAHTPRPRT